VYILQMYSVCTFGVVIFILIFKQAIVISKT
jgi:hypothetical protein